MISLSDISLKKIMKLKNIWLAFKDQLPLTRIWKNFRNGRIKGLMHIRSHENADGVPKIKYNTKATAVKSAEIMAKKVGVPFGNWKCLYCDGFHIGKNRPKDE